MIFFQNGIIVIIVHEGVQVMWKLHKAETTEMTAIVERENAKRLKMCAYVGNITIRRGRQLPSFFL